MHEFLANVLVECGQFTVFAENLNYSAKRLTQVWPSRFPTIQDAIPYEHNPMKLANKVYAGRLGNINEGDGYNFRGSGAIQLTGRSNITNFTNYFNAKFNTTYTPEQIAELLRTDLATTIHSACWFFAIAKNLIQLAIDDELKTIVKRINGGYIGLSERTNFYKKCVQYIK